MTGITVIAIALPLVLGLAIIAVSMADRRQALLQQKISDSIGIYVAPAAIASGPSLDSGSKEDGGLVARWLPSSLANRLQQALGATGDRVALWHFVLAGSVSGALIFVLVSRLLALSPIYSVAITVAAVIAVPVFLFRGAKERFQKAFLHAFPDGLDLMVRAVRAGLPLADAIESIGSEIGGPVGSEFRRVRNGMTIGLELEQALQGAAVRVQALEFRFFIVALSLQRRTGGNLAETLENLSSTLRQRKEMGLKAKALMSEAVASSWLIGLLPFIAGTAIYFLNPDYMQLLFTTPRGQTILGMAATTLGIGVFIIRTLIKGATR